MNAVPARLLLLLLATPAAAFAEEKSAWSVSGFADLCYTAPREDPDDGRNFGGLAAVASRADEPALDFAGIEVRREPSPFGFTLVLAGGDAQRVVHAAEPSWARRDFRFVYQASASYQHGPFLVEAGLFPSHIGFESAFPHANGNYSHSWTATLSPFYQTGARLVYSPNEDTTLELHLLRGWQEIADPVSGPAWGAKAARRWGDFKVSLGAISGDEPDGAGGVGRRSLVDLIVEADGGGGFTYAFEAYRGRQERQEGDAADWNTLAAWARRQSGQHAFTLRAERFDDGDGGISGAARRLASYTATYDLTLHPAARLRLELRRDEATAPTFGGAERQELGLLALDLTF